MRKTKAQRKKYRREMYLKNRKRELELSKIYKETHKEQIVAQEYKKYRRTRKKQAIYHKKWYKKNGEILKRKKRKEYQKNIYTGRKTTRERQQSERDIFIYMYGRKYECCNEKCRTFLCLDHVKNDGAKRRKDTYKSNLKEYRKAIRRVDKSNYQILCFNCNQAKAKTKDGICPHQKVKKVKQIKMSKTELVDEILNVLKDLKVATKFSLNRKIKLKMAIIKLNSIISV